MKKNIIDLINTFPTNDDAHSLADLHRKQNEKQNKELKALCGEVNRQRINSLRRERDELEAKAAKLENFINQGVYANDVDREHKFMLVEQLKAMTVYHAILETRIRLMVAEHAVD
ncbi:hypothetical protein JSQ84_01235 [Limosilactobacillus reuteri]|uniref:crAss001_48 related protein n=1 Tax=Limosilactobacillus reuteri TaxID=1598 RepID=UPI001C2C340D|nr:hypothetical protein [Limosilactobacillus reuteri]MBV0920983.1 hypothetical protein [Limosilactobacillus reuteri]